MTRNELGAALLAGALALAACQGNNAFPTQPFGGAGGSTQLGTISGQVTAAGAGVASAGVQVANGPGAATDASGQYRITGLAQGSYRVSVQVPAGFTLVAGDSATRTANVVPGSPVVINWRLQSTVGTGGTGTGAGGTGGTTP